VGPGDAGDSSSEVDSAVGSASAGVAEGTDVIVSLGLGDAGAVETSPSATEVVDKASEEVVFGLSCTVLEDVCTVVDSLEEASESEEVSIDETLDAAAPVGRKRCSSQVIEVVFTSGLVRPNLPKFESSGSLIRTKGM
jgi:hypothetical protein